MRIVAAMSGGVDSSVAAALLAADGHDVVGLSMQLYDQRDGTESFGSCCTLDDLHDARRVARRIGIPHYIVNFERQFDERVVAPFVEEYAAARTPIPCVRCNSDLKFASLLDRARGFDAAQVATGHYARVETVSASDGSSSIRRLRRAIDPAKDQCYFLFSLTQSQLAHASFPLGDMRKAEVRDYARDHGLLVADKPDSHEICFVPDGDYAAFVEKATARRPARRRGRRCGRAGPGPPSRRPPVHRRPAQGARRLEHRAPVRHGPRCGVEQRHRRSPHRSGTDHADRRRCELDRGTATTGASGHGADPPPSCAGPGPASGRSTGPPCASSSTIRSRRSHPAKPS